MSKDFPNPYAFPTDSYPNGSATTGMMLRDYFAAASLAGLLPRAWDNKGRDDIEIIEQWAKSAYCIADAMLEERRKVL